MKSKLTFYAFFFFCSLISGQSKFLVKILTINESLPSKVYSFNDSLSQYSFINKITADWSDEAYLLTSQMLEDSIHQFTLIRGNQIIVYVSSFSFEDSVHSSPKIMAGFMSISEWKKKSKNYIVSVAEQGYPKAKMDFSCGEMRGDTIPLYVNVIKNNVYYWDSLSLPSFTKLSSPLLETWINGKRNKIFRYSSFQSIEQKLSGNPFFILKSSPQLIFYQNKARLTLFLTPIKNDLFSGIAAFGSDPTTGKIKLNGDFNLRLLNSFHHAETLKFRWKSIRDSRSQLNIQFSIPYIFNEPFSFETSFDLQRVDSTYIISKLKGGIMLLSSGPQNGVEVSLGRNESSIISNSAYNISQKENKLLDYTSVSYGIGIRFSKKNHLLNPTKGHGLDANLVLNRQKVKINARAPENYYDSTKINSFNSILGIDIFRFFPFQKNWTVLLRSNNASIIGNSIPANSYFLLGGLENIRGWEENSIVAKKYSVNTLEIRLAFEESSNIFMFTDYSVAEVLQGKDVSINSLWTLGLGTQVNTGQGLLNIVYALGRRFPESFVFKNSRIHIGYSIKF